MHYSAVNTYYNQQVILFHKWRIRKINYLYESCVTNKQICTQDSLNYHTQNDIHSEYSYRYTDVFCIDNTINNTFYLTTSKYPYKQYHPYNLFFFLFFRVSWIYIYIVLNSRKNKKLFVFPPVNHLTG